MAMANEAAARRNNIQKTAMRPARSEPPLVFVKPFKNDLRMKKIKWSTVKKVLQILVTIVSTVVGTVAVQACGVLA
jgi:hypothetical protein